MRSSEHHSSVRWACAVSPGPRITVGGDGPLHPVPFATDAGYLTPAYGAPPTVILGPGETAQAHRTDEWCSERRIEQATELYAELIAGWRDGSDQDGATLS